MIKLLVTSVVEMSEDEFFTYASIVEAHHQNISRDKFARAILSGHPVNVKSSNGVETTYEVINQIN